MPGFWQRNKRRLAALVTAGAAGAASAYVAYNWWYQLDDNDQPEPSETQTNTNQEASSSGLNHKRDEAQPPLLVSPRGQSDTAHLDAEAHLQHHFDSIQAIADDTTSPALLPALSRAIVLASDVDTSLDRLRRAKEGTTALNPTDKVAVWDALKVASLAELLAACWAVPLLELLVKVQLNVLGRHLYLESALVVAKKQPLGPQVRGLSAPSQERFLSYAEHLAKQGHIALLSAAKKAAETVVEPIALTTPLTADDIKHLVSTAMALLEGERWGDMVLPSPEEIADSLMVKKPDDRAMMPEAEQLLVDGLAVEGLVGEVARIVCSERFHDVAVLSAKQVAQRAVERMTEHMSGEAKLQLAHIVPLLSAQARHLLDVKSGEMAVLGKTEPVRTLCATVYSCGPPL